MLVGAKSFVYFDHLYEFLESSVYNFFSVFIGLFSIVHIKNLSFYMAGGGG